MRARFDRADRFLAAPAAVALVAGALLGLHWLVVVGCALVVVWCASSWRVVRRRERALRAFATAMEAATTDEERAAAMDALAREAER